MRDPNGILEGTGSQVRYIAIRNERDIDRGVLSKYVDQAAKLAFLPKQLLREQASRS